jgi:hypothetical protein
MLHFEIMNLEVDIPEDYGGPLTGMDFANCPNSDSLTNVYNVDRNIQCSSASQANIRAITTQINQAKITVYNRFIISKCSSSVSTIPSPSVGRTKGTSKGTVASTFEKCIISGDKNVDRNIQCSSASQANIRAITTQINQAKITVYNMSLPSDIKLWLYLICILTKGHS